jgi:hypothetical protein
MSEWTRRQFVTNVGLASAALGVAARGASAAEHGGHNSPAGLSSDEAACLEACRSCEQVCATTLQHCLSAGGDHLTGDHVQVMLACVEVCKTSAALITARSSLADKQCGVCADASDACAHACGQAPADAQMRACIDACNACAASCREMIG